jgi:hypothetical protein
MDVEKAATVSADAVSQPSVDNAVAPVTDSNREASVIVSTANRLLIVGSIALVVFIGSLVSASIREAKLKSA